MMQVKLLPKNRAQRVLFLGFLILFALSAIDPPYPGYFMMEHVPTVIAVVLLIVTERRFGMSLLSYAILILFFLLHVLGARYLYSYVPYDRWTEALLGVNLTETFNFTRNHYDRLVHFLFGLMVSLPAYRFARRILHLRRLWASLFAIQFIVAIGTAYELAEWIVALIFAPDWADEYNGQQGDLWDPQKDMLLAAIGAMLSISLAAVVDRRRIKPTP